MNVLILSSGSRNKIVQYFKKELKGIGRVIVTDCSIYAPALYEADNYYIVPRITDSTYLDSILDICKKEKVSLAFSLIDPEISFLSENKEYFEEIGVHLMLSDKEMIETSFEKYKMYQYLSQKGINTPKTYTSLTTFEQDYDNENISFPVIVKPNKGSASKGIELVESIVDLKNVFSKNYEDLIIQEYMTGKEYGVDVYVDMYTGELVSYFIKEKVLMRAGETDKAISVHNSQIENLVKELVSVSAFKGVIDVDIFEKNGKFYVSEVNPRFGGGYPHAYECGINFPQLIIDNILKKKDLKFSNEYKSGVKMMKYSEVIIL